MVSLNVPILARVLRIRCIMTNGVLECPYSRPRAAHQMHHDQWCP